MNNLICLLWLCSSYNINVFGISGTEVSEKKVASLQSIDIIYSAIQIHLNPF